MNNKVIIRDNSILKIIENLIFVIKIWKNHKIYYIYIL